MTILLQDLRFALRQLNKHRGFALVAVLTLGIGIGAATAVFSLVDAVLLRPLPFAHPEQIMSVGTVLRLSAAPKSGPAKGENYTSWPDFLDWRGSTRSFTAISSFHVTNASVGRANSALRRISGTAMSAGMGRVFGLQMQLGRDFMPEEELAGNRSVILSDELWHSEFAGAPDVLGKQISLNEQQFTVVGVLPRGFVFPGPDTSLFWLTEAMDAEGKDPLTKERGAHMLRTFARLRDGVAPAQAQADLSRIQETLAVRYPDTDRQNDHVGVEPLSTALTGDVRQPLRILLAAVGFLLIIACVNVAGLLLTRTVGRQGELAVRAALGASRTAILRQLLLEALTRALAAGLLGTTLAAGALALAPRYLPHSLPHAADVSLDSRVLLFSLLLSVATGLIFGVLPAWRASRLQPAASLSGGRSTTLSRGRHRLHGGLVIAETALSLLMLVGAGLLLRSFQRVLTVHHGFQTQGLLSFRVAFPGKRFSELQQKQFAESVQSRLAALPGVTGATFGFPLPLAGGNMQIGFEVDGHPKPPGETAIARMSTVAPNFFQTMRIPLLHGRNFTGPEGQVKGPHAVIVNQAFADEFFPGEDALNKHIIPGVGDGDGKLPSYEIVGIVANTKRMDLTETAVSEYYVPLNQIRLAPPVFALRTSGDPVRLTDTVRRAVAEVDPAVPVFDVYSYDVLLERNTAMRRFQTILLTGFAAVALLLAAIGLYASLSYMVVERTSELGLRMALGAQRGNVLSLILRHGLALGCIGLAIGLAAAVALTRSIGSLLYDTRPLDLATFTGTTLLLLAVCALSSLIPALRAARLDPANTLRQQ